MNRTTPVKEGEITRKWYVVDATGVPLGRLAAQVAQVLRGKNKPYFSYNMDCGDFVVVVNAEKVVLTGGKKDELIHWHTGWPGGLRSKSRGQLLEDSPSKLVEKAIWGMVPKTRLGRQIFGKLKVYAGSEHPHSAQNPEPLEVRQK
jgi:large subunit ribosomal protein L13